MIVIMKPHAQMRDISAVITRIEDLGYRVHLSEGEERSIIGIIGNGRPIEASQFGRMAGVERAVRVSSPYKLAGRNFHPENTTFKVGDLTFGQDLAIIAGPCAVESRSHIIETAWAIKEAGGHMLQGGAYKPRTSPYAFQGLGKQGLRYLSQAAEETGLPIVTEVVEPELVGLVAEHADVLILGSRSMNNYALLRAVGRANRPCILKRGRSSTIEEWLLAAEYILSHGNTRVMLCERGVAGFSQETHNTFDISAIPLAKQYSHLPVLVDPSNGTGKWDLVSPVAKGAVAAGADGVMLNVHLSPDEAMCDGGQSLKPERFAQLVRDMTAIFSVTTQQR